MCWGMNKDGQLGDGRNTNMIRPIAVGKGEAQHSKLTFREIGSQLILASFAQLLLQSLWPQAMSTPVRCWAASMSFAGASMTMGNSECGILAMSWCPQLSTWKMVRPRRNSVEHGYWTDLCSFRCPHGCHSVRNSSRLCSAAGRGRCVLGV